MHPNRLLLFCLVLAATRGSWADEFGSGANSFTIDFVTIGSPNGPNPSILGAVPYVYRIGKFEIPEAAIDKANALGGLSITKDVRGPDSPASSISWFEAAKFVNWLNTSTGSTPAYKFDASGNFQLWQPLDSGYDVNNLYRNRLATYFLPSTDEWHKAAYYDPIASVFYEYPTGSSAVPDGIDFAGDPNFQAVFNDGGSNANPNAITNVGSTSPFGTAGQGGNVSEWEESSVDRTNDSPGKGRGFRGGAWGSSANLLKASNRNGIIPSFEGNIMGFRVASNVPEPGTFSFLISSLIFSLARVRFKL